MRGLACEIHEEGFLAVLGDSRHLENTHVQPQRVVDGSHPARIAPREIIIDRDKVDAASQQGVEIDRHGRHEGLAFAGAHLGDLPVMQCRAANDLHVVVAQSKFSFGCLPYSRKGFGHDFI